MLYQCNRYVCSRQKWAELIGAQYSISEIFANLVRYSKKLFDDARILANSKRVLLDAFVT